MDKRTRDGRANPYPGITAREGFYQISYRDPITGRRRNKRTRFSHPAEIEKARRLKRQLERGDAAGRSATPTFARLAQRYLDHTQLAASVRRTHRSRLNNYWMPLCGDLPIDECTFDVIMPLTSSIAHLAPKTQRHVISVGSRIFRLAMASNHITHNPTEQFEDIKVPRAAPDPFEPSEREELLAQLQGNRLLFYTIRFFAGLRPGEVIALTWGDIDLDARQISVSKQIVEGRAVPHTKTHEQRKVHMRPEVVAALRACETRFGGGYVFVRPDGKPYANPDKFAAALVAAMLKLGIRYRSPYNARHTCASMMLTAGMDYAYCAEQLGHSLQMFLTIYAKLIGAGKRDEQAEKWDQI